MSKCTMCDGTGVHKYINIITKKEEERICLGCGGEGEGDLY